MAKRFDCEDEPNEFMEAPCRCDCGNWFDLDDGYLIRSKGMNGCRECHDKEEEIETLRNQYWEYDSGDKPYKREKKKILNMLKEMGAELNKY